MYASNVESTLTTSSPIPASVVGWRPQAFGSKNVKDVIDPIIEPLWEGSRVLVRVGLNAAGSTPGHPSIEVRDDQDEELVGELEGIPDAIASAARAATMVLDGYMTGQATRSLEGLSLEGPEAPTASDMMTQLVLGSAGERKRKQLLRDEKILASGGPLAFVAVDLLLVDDEPVINVPLLERKRLLEGVLIESELVRRTAYVRPPVDPWIGTWRGLGFFSLAYKAANSRYRPGEPNPGWALARIPRR